VACLDEAREAREAEGLGVRFAFFSASSFALISECGTAINRRMKLMRLAEFPVTVFAGSFGTFATVNPQK
jgi:hypothetical protein